MLITRRQFVSATAAAALGAGVARPHAASWDLVVQGGRVIDPSLGIDAVRDVAIAGGRIAAVEPGLDAGEAQVVNASGRIVVPGLIDVHTHYAREAQGPRICLEDGVTAWVDAGSAGADAIDDQVAVARAAPQQGRLLVNIGRQGILPGGDTMDLDLADVGAAREAIARHRDYVVGVKARLSRNVAADDVEVLRRTQAAASAFDLPVMIHMGQTVSPLSTLFGLLKPGDVVTHMYAPPPNAIVGDDGRIRPAVLEARRRGIRFDVANGRRGHIRWDTFDQVMQTGFLPDTISTDGNTTSRSVPGVVDLPNVMSKFLDAGMSLTQVVACVTNNASRVFPHLNDRGTLHVGARADLALLELRHGLFDFVDNYENLRTGGQRLFPRGTVLGGEWLPRAV
ncbi:MAG: amidohydrolase/deacetylase family metallohydrolase [Acidobacteria bacterium]|nr:amidohydrolase/deacetylase family metallohydrolase [Acidobacteriota bacterium]